MKLLQHSWSDMLVLDHLHHRLHSHLPDDAPLPNGQKFDLLALALLGVPASMDRFNDISMKLQEIKFDVADYVCLKFLLLLNPGSTLSRSKFYFITFRYVFVISIDAVIRCIKMSCRNFGELSDLLETHFIQNK